MTLFVKSFLRRVWRYISFQAPLRVFRPSVSSIVAPLNQIADELKQLQADNLAANETDVTLINRIGARVGERIRENTKAEAAESKIRNLLS